MRSWALIFKTKNDLRRSFTLIEMIMVVTIFSALAVGIVSSFFSGLKLYARSSQGDLSKSELLVNLEIIAKEARQSPDMPLIECEGDRGKFSFPFISNGAIVKRTYSFSSEDKLLRSHEAPLAMIMAGKEQEGTVQKTVMAVDEFSMSYLTYDKEQKVYAWKDEWVKGAGRFPAVRLRGKYKGEEFDKTIFLPVS